MEKISKFDKIDKLAGKGERCEKKSKIDNKSYKIVKSDKVDKTDKITKFVEKIEKNDRLEKSEQATTRKRRKVFRIKNNKKEKDIVVTKDKDSSKEIAKDVADKEHTRESILNGPRDILRDTIKNLHKSKEPRKDLKNDVLKSNAKFITKSILKDHSKDTVVRDGPKNIAKDSQKIVKELLKVPMKETMKDISKELNRDVRKDSSRDSTIKTISQDSHRDVHMKSIQNIKEKDQIRKERHKDLAKTRKDFQKLLIRDPGKELAKDIRLDTIKDDSKDSIKEATFIISRGHKSTIANTVHPTNFESGGTNLFVAPCLINPISNASAKSALKACNNNDNSTNDNNKSINKDHRMVLDDYDTDDEDIEKDERKANGTDPLKSANIQTINGLNFPGRSAQSIISLPAPPSNILNIGHLKRREHTTTTQKITPMDSARLKNNELQRFFDPIKELCISIPEINEMFNIHQLIGYGAFSTVLLATLKRESKVSFEKRAKFAVKHLSPNNSPKRIKREMQFMTKIGGTNNVVKLHCCCRHHDSVAFVMPYLECDHFKYYFRLMEPAEVQLYMQSLLVALRHVHKFNVIHRDVKPGNFLYNRVQRKFMLVDFGLAEEVIDLAAEDSVFADRDHEVKKNVSRAGTRGFRPPEVLLRFMNQTTAVDIWAVGVIFLSILSKVYPPFKPPNDQWAMKEIIGIFGDKQIVKVAKKLRCPIPATESCKPLDLRKICVHFRNLCKNPAVNKTQDFHAFDYADKKCKNCRQCIYNCLCQTPKSQSTDISIALDCYPPSTYDLLQKLLEVGPFERITAEEALKHAFFKERFPRSESSHNNFYMPIRGSLMQILRKN